jgi:hypothetical protein
LGDPGIGYGDRELPKAHHRTPVNGLLNPQKADTRIGSFQISIGSELRGGRDHLQGNPMENREFLAGGISEDISVTLILFKDLSQAGSQDSTPPTRAVSVNDLENGDPIPMAASDL